MSSPNEATPKIISNEETEFNDSSIKSKRLTKEDLCYRCRNIKDPSGKELEKIFDISSYKNINTDEYAEFNVLVKNLINVRTTCYSCIKKTRTSTKVKVDMIGFTGWVDVVVTPEKVMLYEPRDINFEANPKDAVIVGYARPTDGDNPRRTEFGEYTLYLVLNYINERKRRLNPPKEKTIGTFNIVTGKTTGSVLAVNFSKG